MKSLSVQVGKKSCPKESSVLLLLVENRKNTKEQISSIILH